MNRREAIKSLAGTGSIVSGSLWQAGTSLAADHAVASDIVRFGSDIEPLVRLIEETPRSDCIEVVAGRLNTGLSYRELLSALFLAGIRNVSPQPPGFKFHCVFVLHSANQLSLDAPHRERLLPLLWALDYFKQSQQRDVDEGDFQLRKPKGPLPAASKAWAEFHAAMESWDEERADRAVTALARTKGGHEVIEGLWRYGARDYRNIGHKAIFTASTWRTLQAIGWRHAEPALRSLILGLLDFGPDRRMNGYSFEDQSHTTNAELARKSLARLPPDWISTESADTSPARGVLEAVRSAEPLAASTEVADMLAKGKASSRDAWDGIHLAAGDLMLRLPGILGVHCVTSANALHYAFRMSSDAETRLYLLLQGVGWMGQFARYMSRNDQMRDLDLSKLERADASGNGGDEVAAILEQLGSDTDEAARKAIGYAMDHQDLTEFSRMARNILFHKAEESHRFKYAAAVFEDLELVSPAWRPHMLATSTYYLQGPADRNSAAVVRARKALDMA
ncbi:MAG: hypothetical protein F4X12_16665 [Acidobacteriia bacterium]|nr:hypothetical protein [Terriglobia bacterium]